MFSWNRSWFLNCADLSKWELQISTVAGEAENIRKCFPIWSNDQSVYTCALCCTKWLTASRGNKKTYTDTTRVNRRHRHKQVDKYVSNVKVWTSIKSTTLLATMNRTTQKDNDASEKSICLYCWGLNTWSLVCTLVLLTHNTNYCVLIKRQLNCVHVSWVCAVYWSERSIKLN